MIAQEIIQRIRKLESDALARVEQAMVDLAEADELAKAMKKSHGSRFVCRDKAYKLVHRAIGFKPGNRDWLEIDTEVKVIN